MRERKALQGRELWDRARTLGISFGALPFKTLPGADPNPDEYDNAYEIQRRIMEFERHQRDHRVAIVAIISSVASMVSAMAAWYAVVR